MKDIEKIKRNKANQTKEERREWQQQYDKQRYQENKEQIKQKKKQYRQENKERINQYYQENKEQINLRNKLYNQAHKLDYNCERCGFVGDKSQYNRHCKTKKHLSNL